jgi:RNA polymerase sigma factor for flagellar operon FliA
MNHDALWKKYKSTDNIKYRNELIVLYQPLLRATARKISQKLPSNVEFDDLVSYGMFGLIDAIKRFDLDRGFKFETFAMKRIQGSIYDGIRSMDWVPRNVRAQSKQLNQAYSDLQGDDHTKISDEEVIEYLDWDKEKLQRVRERGSSGGNVISLDEKIRSDNEGESISLSDLIADRSSDANSQFELFELQSSLSGALSSLDEKEQIVLALYYHERLKFSEIGDIFGVSESRICQIHMQAIEDIKSYMISG